jgi:hypothetical protein
MAGDSPQPLSTEEAKERLRAATREVGLQAWVHHSPWGFLVIALGSGYLAGRLPVMRTSMMFALARTILTLSNK